MSFPRYERYKDSGIEWLCEVPAHWEVRTLRGLAREGRNTFIDGDWIESPFITDEGIRLIQTGNVGIGEYKEQGFRYVSEQTFYDLNCTEVEPGNILICRLAEPVGRACLAPKLGVKMITSVDVCILKSSKEVHTDYIVYLLSSSEYLGYMDGQCRGGTRDRVSRSFLGTVRLAIPSISEQQAIAAFLDCETAKIDALIAEQKRLIELLKEKRQAVISHAVTKGLNPAAPMKDSGIEWLGEVPEHWSVVPLKWFARCASGDSIPSDSIEPSNDDNSILVIGGNGVMGYTNQVNITYPVLVIGRVGALCGNVHFIQQPVWVTDNALILDASPEAFDLLYLAEVLRSRNLNNIASTTAQPLITGTQVRDQRVPRPTLTEQSTIATFIDNETTKLDALTAQAQTAITLLQERRTALISATVTGKIDVRGLVVAQPEREVTA